MGKAAGHLSLTLRRKTYGRLGICGDGMTEILNPPDFRAKNFGTEG